MKIQLFVSVAFLMLTACGAGGGTISQLYPTSTGGGVVSQVWQFQSSGQTAVSPYDVVEGGTSISLNNINMTIMGDNTVFLSAVVLNQTGFSTFLSTVLTPSQSATSLVVENGHVYLTVNRNYGIISLEFDNDGNRSNDETVSYQAVRQ